MRQRARAFGAAGAEGYAASVLEAAFRFAITTDAMSTVLIGTSDLAQLDFAAAAVAKAAGSRPRHGARPGRMAKARRHAPLVDRVCLAQRQSEGEGRAEADRRGAHLPPSG